VLARIRAAEAAIQAEKKAQSITLADALNDFLRIGDREKLTIKGCRQKIEQNFKDWLNKPLCSISGHEVAQKFLEIQERVSKKRGALNQRRLQAGESLTTFNNKDGKGEEQRAFRYLRAIFNMVKADEINVKPLLDRNPINILKAKRLTRSLIP
jgi:16S rRNA C967 or C1407 C5-methylase (RsmB/RsmF family)